MAPTTNGGSSTNGNASTVHATASATGGSDAKHVQSFWARYEQLQHADVMKNVLIEDVVTRYENLVNTHNEYVRQHQAERELAQNTLEREEKALGNVRRLQHILNRDPFVLVLIDGDGMIFNQKYMREGENGGKLAAAALYKAVQDWSVENVPECPPDAKIVVRVYANLRGLADACTKTGLVSTPTELEEFARGFTRGKTLFDFVDVGYGKDRADGKVAETFKLFLYDYHCRQILFGCSHDNGYARLLEQYTETGEEQSRVTLLEGVPFEKELATLPFATTKFPGIFRDTKIITGPVDLLTGNLPVRSRLDSNGLSATSDVFTPRTNTPFSPYSPSGSIPQYDGVSINQRPPHLRTTSMASTAATSDSGAVGSWAAVTKRSAGMPYKDLERTVSGASDPMDQTIPRNKHGHRIDGPMDYNREEVQRLKRVKMCNQHYIGQGCCHYNAGKPEKCPHKHEIRLTQQEKYWLRVVARETPCKKGLFCDDTKCIYGHRCPFPTATEGSSRGSGACLNGEHCRFSREMHGVDTKVVKMKLVTGAF